MTQTYLLSVEIKTIKPNLNDLEAHSTLTIFCNSQDQCFIAKGLDEIKTAIIGAIPHLGTNSRHPLLFDVQILPGDKTDALIASCEPPNSPTVRRRLCGYN